MAENIEGDTEFSFPKLVPADNLDSCSMWKLPVIDVRGGTEGEKGGLEGDEERMDQLWERFNDELPLLRRRAGSISSDSMTVPVTNRGKAEKVRDRTSSGGEGRGREHGGFLFVLKMLGKFLFV